jgi:hypothetical protein
LVHSDHIPQSLHHSQFSGSYWVKCSMWLPLFCVGSYPAYLCSVIQLVSMSFSRFPKLFILHLLLVF